MKAMYIHIPFCKEKCKYCDFNSFKSEDVLIQEYVEALCLEIGLYKEGKEGDNITSIFIGGGTPSVLSIAQLRQIVHAIKTNFDLRNLIEFSIEMNPDTVTEALAQGIKGLGINRVSMGLQSSDDDLLQVLGRIHSFNEFKYAYDLLRQHGIDNINVDLMFGLPNQTQDQWMKTLEDVLSLEPNHISAYSLKIEEGTPFDDLYEKGLIQIPSEEEDRKMYHYAIERLKKANLNQYEISNFSRCGEESKHNLAYWLNSDYYGFGLSAHGSLNNQRYGNCGNIQEYMRLCHNQIKPVESIEDISMSEKLFETIMLGLRLNKGVDMILVNQMFSIDMALRYEVIIEEFVSKGMMVVDKGYMRLTETGMDVSNSIMMEFMEDDE